MQTQEDIKGGDQEKLWDIEERNINKTDNIKSKTGKFIEETDGNMSSHINKGYVVRNYFSDEGYSATEALIHYIKKIAEINY